MRGGLSSIQQTLTHEAATVLRNSIAEAGRRNHGQTTPLHVAATLLTSPTGFLRQACIRSHPNSSHPLQCRALELCFSVALERLPTAQQSPSTSGSAPGPDPPISNALMAALKRAQAHQRRGCPEQQQQPLLAVKVELEQLIISILDDPSVSRVMREASFSSPAVKAAIEQALNSGPNSGSGPKIGLGFRPISQPGLGGVGRNLYLNPRLQQQQQQRHQESSNGSLQPGLGRVDDVKRVMDILTRVRKRNPVLVGESEPEIVVKEVVGKIRNKEIHDGILKDVEVVSLQKELGLDKCQMMVGKIKELRGLIERRMGLNSSGVILDLGDMKWLVDQPPPNQRVSEVVTEMGKILRNFGERSKIWLIGTATCETYLRCQVYHPTMEIEWDLQVVSIVARPPVPGTLPRLGSNGGILSSSVECLSPMKSFQISRVSEELDPLRRFSCCPQCSENYNQEVAKLVAVQAENSLSKEVKSKSDETRSSLPPWLQTARTNAEDSMKGASDSIQNKDQDLILRQKTQELRKTWMETCLHLHPTFHHGVSLERITPSPLSLTSLYKPNLLGRQPLQPKLQQPKRVESGLQLSIGSPIALQLGPNRSKTPPGSPVGTDLALGRTTTPDKTQKDLPVDADSYKKLFKGLLEKVCWQTDAASTLASTITQCKLGNGKRQVNGSKGDIWILFSGPDRIGKNKMANALSELVCGSSPVLISLSLRQHDGHDSVPNFRGKTAIDRIAEAVRRNPCSVIMLEDIDEADMLVQGSIKRGMERGRLSDSHGREISLGNVIFILTSKEQKGLSTNARVDLNEEKLISLASGGWQLKISIDKKSTGKRPPHWIHDDHENRSTKQKKDTGSALLFDLNQTADIEDDRLDGSHNSSGVTVDHEEEQGLGHETRGSPTTSSIAPELLDSVDEVINFKPVDFTPIRHNIERMILSRFSTIVGDKVVLKLQSDALEKIMSGVWLGQTTIESWLEKAFIPTIHRLKTTLGHSEEVPRVVQLEVDKESGGRDHGEWLPSTISVVVDAQ